MYNNNILKYTNAYCKRLIEYIDKIVNNTQFLFKIRKQKWNWRKKILKRQSILAALKYYIGSLNTIVINGWSNIRE